MSTAAHSPATTHFYIFRHGQSEFNAQGVLQGHLESPLTDLGRQQARSLANKIRQWNIQHIASSHLGRAQQTAQICAQALGVSHSVVPGLAERQLGCWQGQALNDLPEFAQFQQHCYQATSLLPGNDNGYGETTATVRQRMQTILYQLANQHLGKNILMISHGDALACLMSLFTAPVHLHNTQGMKLVCQHNKLKWEGLID